MTKLKHLNRHRIEITAYDDGSGQIQIFPEYDLDAMSRIGSSIQFEDYALEEAIDQAIEVIQFKRI